MKQKRSGYVITSDDNLFVCWVWADSFTYCTDGTVIFKNNGEIVATTLNRHIRWEDTCDTL